MCNRKDCNIIGTYVPGFNYAHCFSCDKYWEDGQLILLDHQKIKINMKKKIYIAGKVTGLPYAQVWEKFDNVQKRLMNDGHIPHNPVAMVKACKLEQHSWEDIMKECLKILVDCDEVHMLPCWKESRGATLERDLALRLNIPVIYL